MQESCEEHKRQRLIRRHQLATSEDPKAKAIHEEFADFQHQRKTNDNMYSWRTILGYVLHYYEECSAVFFNFKTTFLIVITKQ